MQDPANLVVVMLYDGCTIAEIIELATRIERAGVSLIYASVDGKALRDQSGLAMTPDTTFEALDPTTVDAVVVPGGDTMSIMGDSAVASLLTQVRDLGGIVAGICAGVLAMADAGVLGGRRATHNYRAPWAPPPLVDLAAPYFAGVTIEPDLTVGVVTDGTLITALPNATFEFAMTVLLALGLVEPDRAALIQRHLNGEFVSELFGA